MRHGNILKVATVALGTFLGEAIRIFSLIVARHQPARGGLAPRGRAAPRSLPRSFPSTDLIAASSSNPDRFAREVASCLRHSRSGALCARRETC
jgi:hypothetical protein